MRTGIKWGWLSLGSINLVVGVIGFGILSGVELVFPLFCIVGAFVCMNIALEE